VIFAHRFRKRDPWFPLFAKSGLRKSGMLDQE
jgi:hypothetical protein